MKLEGQNILILSNEPWGNIWYSKHNYANELSKKNKVYFLNPPRPFSPTKFFDSKIRTEKINDNLTVLEYANVLPVSLFNFWKLNDVIVLKRLKKYFAKNNIKDLLFWTFDPIRLAFPEILDPQQVIVHAVDDYIFSYPSEAFLAKKANQIICVSEKFVPAYKKYNSHVSVIPHAIPDDEFLPVNTKRNSRLTGVFIGKMDSRIDLEFNLDVFRSFPAIQFKIVGTHSEEFVSRLKSSGLNNVVLIPPIHSHEIKNYVKAADFCFIFKRIYPGNNIYSHKLLQYLAQGKPIFGTDFSDISTELKNNLYLSDDRSEIKKMLTAFVKEEESIEKVMTRINYAKQFTFSRTISSIEEILKLIPQSKKYIYYSEISAKTKILNFFRKALTTPFFDKPLARLSQNRSGLSSFIHKIIPPEYIYKNPSWRQYESRGIKMNLNISNLVDHCVYFSMEQKAIDNFAGRLKPDDTVIDVGANIGYTTLLFSRTCHKGRVISFEPSKELHKTVLDHIKLNDLKNVTCLNIGLGEKEKTTTLYKVSENNSGMNRIFENAEASSNSESITIKTLDAVMAEQNVKTVNAIKIDVEGYEYKILQGAYNTLKENRPTLLIEIDDVNLKEQGAKPVEIFKFLSDLNYTIFEADTMRKIELSHDYSNVHFDVICFKNIN